MAEGPSPTLKTPTYLGLVFSQFLAAFNDQATHIIAVFYASDMLVRYAKVPWIDEKTVVFIVPACFVAPFFLFSPLAGVLADKYSKRNIVVFWKLAEVAMMGLAMVGFLLPTLAAAGWGEPRTMAIWSAAISIGAVFLMGTHSAFFVPAKYGIMPEILHPAVLSKGNGFLEGSSFLAQILGTSFGGLLYGPLKPTFETGELEAGSTWIIGLVLFLLAVIGAVASMFMGKVPPAARDKVLTFNPLAPLANNLSVVRRSKPLILAVIGIAFFTSMVLYMRQTLLYEGETSKDLHAARAIQAKDVLDKLMHDEPREGEEPPPGAEQTAAFVPDATEAQQAEMRVAMLVAFIGMGVGFGSWLAGYLSGAKIELGLVPIGGVFIAAAATALAAVTNDGGSTWPTVTCLILVGVAAGLYIVPLYTLLQDRAPKQSKGSLVATSNFMNSTAGLAAVAIFLVVTTVFEGTMQASRSVLESLGAEQKISGLERKMFIPRLLFLTAAVTTIGMLVALRRRIPDFFLRSIAWMRSYGRVKLALHQVHNLPGTGPVILLTNAATLSEALHVMTATDRACKFLVVEAGPNSTDSGEKITRFFARRAGYVTLNAAQTNATTWDSLRQSALAALRREDILAIAAGSEIDSPHIQAFVTSLRQEVAATVVPVSYQTIVDAAQQTNRRKHIHLRFGHAVGGTESADTAWEFLANPSPVT
jgi:acyl-[acyl-carrier-protein]-phospholipid O-acyltransferase/long-chain-fatty-acid--[acyl-carrier-protein] ligase